MSQKIRVFRPSEGAVLDLDSLSAIPTAIEGVLGAWLGSLVGFDEANPGLILEGLDVDGTLASDQEGPPGAVNAPSESSLRIKPGRAVVFSDKPRRPYLIQLTEPVAVDLTRIPTNAARTVALAIRTLDAEVQGAASIRSASEVVELRVGATATPGVRYLALALSAGNSRVWCTDLRRLWRPEHPGIVKLDKILDDLLGGTLQGPVWEAAIKTSPFQGLPQTDNVLRRQITAVAAVQAARAALNARPTTTEERVSILASLLQQLRKVAPDCAESLRRRLCASEAPEPYWQRMGAAR